MFPTHGCIHLVIISVKIDLDFPQIHIGDIVMISRNKIRIIQLSFSEKNEKIGFLCLHPAGFLEIHIHVLFCLFACLFSDTKENRERDF